MNILIYFDGESKLDSTGNSLYCVDKILGSACFNSLIKEEYKIKIILPENSLSNFIAWGKDANTRIFRGTHIDRNKLDYFMNNVEKATISDEELISCFNQVIIINELYNLDLEEKIDEKSFDRIKQLILKKTGNFKPDIIVSYPYNLNFLRRIFENKMVLVTEWSIFSRYPLPPSIYFDPIGSIKMSFLNTFADNIKNYPITEKDNQKVEEFKKKITSMLSKTLDVSHLIEPYKKRFRKIILCPLVGVFYSEGMCPFADDHAVVRYVMKHVAPDIGVVFTVHPGPKTISISEICYYQEKYPNFIYIEELDKSLMPSVALFPYVDAMINFTSLTGTMALLWDLPIISLYGHYNDWMKDCGSLDDLETVLTNPITNKNNRIYWYFTHFAIFENRFDDGKFYKQYFEKKLEKFNKKGITFDFYEQNEDFEEVSNYIIKTLQENIDKSKETPKNLELSPKKGVFLFGKLKIFNMVKLKKEVKIYFFGIKIMHISFSRKKMFLF